MTRIVVRSHLILFCLAVILVGCKAQQNLAEPITPATVSTEKASPFLPTQTIQPLLSSTSAPSSTPFLEATPTDLLPNTDTYNPQVESPSPTSDLPATLIAAETPMINEFSTSPDGKLYAEVIRYDCTPTTDDGQANAYEALRLVRRDDSGEKMIADQVQSCGGLGAFGLGALWWSKDNRFLYFSQAAQGVPDGLCSYWERPLNAYNLESGESYNLAQGPLTPDQQTIAFWDRGGFAVVLWNVENGEAGHFSAVEAGWSYGPIAWSPDGKKLAYLETQEWCYPWGETVLVLVDPASGEQSLLLRSNDPSFSGLEWGEANVLSLHDENDQVWQYDLSNGALTR